MEQDFKLYYASAGSGKTYTLVKTILSILLKEPNPQYFDQILAITFTNKAANEMKNRMLEWLDEFADESQYQSSQTLESIHQELNIPKETLHIRAKQVLSSILHNYSKFSVSTIDKFNLRLMKSFAKDLGLSLNFDVELDKAIILQQALDLMLSGLQEDDFVTNMLIDICLLNLEDQKSWNPKKSIAKTLKNVLSEQNHEFVNQLKQVSLNEFNDYRKQTYQDKTSLYNNIIKQAQQALDLIELKGLVAQDFYQGANGIVGYFNKVTNGNFKPPSETVNKIITEEKHGKSKCSKATEAVIIEIFPSLKAHYQQINSLLPKYFLAQAIHEKIANLSLVNEINKYASKIKEDKNVLLLSEFNQLINSHLKDQPSAYIYERIGNRYHHFFIDEFQDTSTLQWDNMLPLVENAIASGDSVMLVGDVKQSIYRWRGGNPDLMIGLSQNPYIQLKNDLDTNWRSDKCVVEFNNQLYTFAANYLNNSNHQKIYQLNEQKPSKTNGGYVQVDLFEHQGYTENTLQQILNNIQQAQASGYDFGDIAVLYQHNVQGRKIANFLVENNVQVLAQDSLLLSNSDEVMLLIELLEMLQSDNEPLELSNFLIRFYKIHHPTQVDFTQITKQILANPKQIISTLHELGYDLQFLENPILSLYDWLEKASRNLKLLDLAPAYVMSFLDLVLEFSSLNGSSIQSFLNHWQQIKNTASIAGPEDSNAVKMLTIHKSKGLEFPVVIVPFSNFDMKKNHIWIATDNPTIKNSYIEELDQQNAEGKVLETIEQEHQMKQLDRINTLYVATTRAKNQLYIINKQPPKTKPKEITSLTQQIMVDFVNQHGNNNTYTYGNLSTSKKETQKQSNHSAENQLIEIQSYDWANKISISQESKKWQSQEIKFGNLVHDFLSNIKHTNDIQLQLKRFTQNGLLNKNQIGELQNIANTVVEHPLLMEFYTQPYKIYNERDFINQNGEVFRPDRVQTKANQCVVIDYKTGKANNQDINQIKEYAIFFSDLGYQTQSYLVYIQPKEVQVKQV